MTNPMSASKFSLSDSGGDATTDTLLGCKMMNFQLAHMNLI